MSCALRALRVLSPCAHSLAVVWCGVLSDDTFPGHPKSIDSLLVIDEDTVVSGSSDGLLRIVQLYPHKLLGVVGEHGEYPIECVRLSGDKTVLGSSSHDQSVKVRTYGWERERELWKGGRVSEGE